MTVNSYRQESTYCLIDRRRHLLSRPKQKHGTAKAVPSIDRRGMQRTSRSRSHHGAYPAKEIERPDIRVPFPVGKGAWTFRTTCFVQSLLKVFRQASSGTSHMCLHRVSTDLRDVSLRRLVTHPATRSNDRPCLSYSGMHRTIKANVVASGGVEHQRLSRMDRCCWSSMGFGVQVLKR